jgi:hypothetical protein
VFYFILFFLLNYTEETAPKIIELKPHNLSILAKGNAIFECHVVSYPLAQITWKKNNKKLSENNKKFKIIHGSNLSLLRVREASYVALNNVLNITCTAENRHGVAEATSFLHVTAGNLEKTLSSFISLSLSLSLYFLLIKPF